MPPQLDNIELQSAPEKANEPHVEDKKVEGKKYVGNLVQASINESEYDDLGKQMISIDEAQKMVREAEDKARRDTRAKVYDEYDYPSKRDMDLSNMKIGDLDKYIRMTNALEANILRRNQNSPATFADKISQMMGEKMENEFASRFMSTMFPSAPVASRTDGWINTAAKLMNTEFMKAIGLGIGQNSPALTKMLGIERIGRLMDTYTGGGQPTGQQEISQEQQMEEIKAIIMSLDSRQQEHVLKFMEITKIADYGQAQRSLLATQEDIIRSRAGVPRDVSQGDMQNQVQQDTGNMQVRQERREVNRNDINRQLINQYDNQYNSQYNNQYPNQQYDNRQYDNQQYNSQGSQGTPMGPGGNDFFNSQSQQSMNNPGFPPGIETKQSPEELILSLSPDDPTSVHTYMAMKGIAGVDQVTVKKLLIKEQEKLRESMVSGASSITEKQPSDVTVETPSKEESSNTVSKSNRSLDNIMELIQKLGNSFDNGLKTMSEEIEFLKNKVIVLESSSQVLPVSSNLPIPQNNIIIDTESFVENLNEEILEDLKNEKKEDNSYVIPEIPVDYEENKRPIDIETGKDTFNSQEKENREGGENKGNGESEGNGGEKPNLDIDWFGERGKIQEEVKNERMIEGKDELVKETTEETKKPKRKKFIISKKE